MASPKTPLLSQDQSVPADDSRIIWRDEDDEICTDPTADLVQGMRGLIAIWNGQVRQLPPLTNHLESDLLIPYHANPSRLELFVDSFV